MDIDALSFLLSAIIIQLDLRSYSRNEQTEKIHLWNETRDTFAFMKTRKVILYTVVFGFVFNFLTLGMVIIIPTIAVEHTLFRPVSLSLFYIAELIGMVLGGSMVIVSKNEKLLNYLLIDSVGEGLVMSIMGFSLLAEGMVIIAVTLILLVNGIFQKF